MSQYDAKKKTDKATLFWGGLLTVPADRPKVSGQNTRETFGQHGEQVRRPAHNQEGENQ